MRIAVDATTFYRKVDGVGRYSVHILTELSKIHPSWEFVVVAFSNDRHKQSLLDNNSRPNIKYTYLPYPRTIYQGLYNKLNIRIPVDIFLRDVDLLIGFNFAIFPYVKQIPSLIVVHDLAYIDLPETIDRENLKKLKRHVPHTLAEANIVAAASDFTKNEITARFAIDTSRIITVSNSVDDMFFTTNKTKRDGSILCVGTIEPRKNLDRVIKAYDTKTTRFQQKHPLVIVGRSGWGAISTDNIKGSTKEHVIFTGYLSDIELINKFKSSSLFVTMSLYEGFGLPIIEAFASRIPVCASRIPAHTEIGGHVIYANPLSVEDIAASLSDVDNVHDSHKLDENQALARKYNWRVSAKNMSSAISKLLK